MLQGSFLDTEFMIGVISNLTKYQGQYRSTGERVKIYSCPHSSLMIIVNFCN